MIQTSNGFKSEIPVNRWCESQNPAAPQIQRLVRTRRFSKHRTKMGRAITNGCV
jgi:hypothetical protein